MTANVLLPQGSEGRLAPTTGGPGELWRSQPGPAGHWRSDVPDSTDWVPPERQAAAEALVRLADAMQTVIGTKPCRWCDGPVTPSIAIASDGSVSWKHKAFCSAPCRKGTFVGKRRPLPKKTRAAVFARDGRICKRCGWTEWAPGEAPPGVWRQLEIDHVYPVARGGTDDLDNLQVLCSRCNQQKAHWQ